MLICSLVDEIVPLGRNMWEQVTVQFNANRARGTPELDVDSLRRKFKNLYMKPKPSGHGEVPARLKPIVMVMAVQRKIEEQGGVQTSHDDLDDGGDDEELEGDMGGQAASDRERNEASTPPPRRQDSSYGTIDELSEEHTPLSLHSQPQVTIITERYGAIDVALADAYQMSDEDGRDPRIEEADSMEESRSGDAPEEHHTRTRETLQPSDLLTTLASPPPSASSGCAAGRPRSTRREPLPTVATPNGPALGRDPARAEADATEEALNPRLGTSINRLGGEDLRIVRDNLSVLKRGPVNEYGKRPSSEGARSETTSGTSTFSKTRRTRAKQRVNEIQREIEELDGTLSSSSDDIMRMLLLFQKDSDRRTEAEDHRRREEREERAEAERLERVERERVRRQESEEADRRRQQEIQAAREERDELRHQEAARELNLAQERDESRRRFEERLELERIRSSPTT
ncbi:hypothetical protein PHMEG_00018236 [Phytophthora megakarya]|uniref:DUF6818 domain-containing protein n=1 Tax=Phytophthora megakarya TaxID=4795 RepID=A0A225VUA1_9STRA|nr:hypothetical protein PHMEG_00018236 [Phytophthora megakarya]